MALSDDSRRTEAAVAEALTLFSTLTTAADVWHSVSERQAGHDPTTQEGDAFVRPYLRTARQTLLEVLLELHASLAHAHTTTSADAPSARLVRHGGELMLLQRAARLLQPIHQRLLSLYPAVPESLVEEARALHTTAGQLLDADHTTHHADASAFVRRAFSFCDALEGV